MPSPPKYGSQGSFDVVHETWERAKEEIRQTLIEKARQRGMIPYSELVGRVKSVNFDAFDQRLFAILGQISVSEHEQGRPLLSVLVVQKSGDMQPGEGFFELAQSLGRNTSDVLKAWIEEVPKVYQHWNKAVPPKL
ncbi:MAG: hypothetical protein AVDCRST_MAG64-3468 [uncultured Phycisphaerae bacterium]|uniref:Uncharacterized protein n=1 Tax=uncultured Phycisphaerae bacterium TaxID=904963 RepID=A0A6J4Q5A9_9BACT|nr:MAG: hypothetical protein AVDCRST_MAG64-3468 [uncultured Phycisphaerae bacterium]